jgi:hypothetical protein
VLVVGQAVAVGVTCWLQQGLMSDWLSLLGVTTMLLPLPAALMLSRRCRRSNYGNGRFMAWLLLWTIVGTAVADGLCTSAVLLWGVGHHDVSEIVFYLLVGSLMFGLFAYRRVVQVLGAFFMRLMNALSAIGCRRKTVSLRAGERR